MLVVKHRALITVMALGLLAGGCARHRHTARLVYVPSSPPAVPLEPASATDAMVIEEPPPPVRSVEPVEISPTPEPAAPKPVVRPRRPSKSEPSATEENTEPQAAPGLPPLEPRASSQQQQALRNQIATLQAATKQRIVRLEQLKVSSADRKFLDDARHFLEESQRAVADGDLQRSQNLAHKAALLVDAVERNY